MSIIKISNTKSLEELQVMLTFRLGKKPTQQEVLDYCIQLGLENPDMLANLFQKEPILDTKKVKRILKKRASRGSIPYITEDQDPFTKIGEILGNIDFRDENVSNKAEEKFFEKK